MTRRDLAADAQTERQREPILRRVGPSRPKEQHSLARPTGLLMHLFQPPVDVDAAVHHASC